MKINNKFYNGGQGQELYNTRSSRLEIVILKLQIITLIIANKVEFSNENYCLINN